MERIANYRIIRNSSLICIIRDPDYDRMLRKLVNNTGL